MVFWNKIGTGTHTVQMLLGRNVKRAYLYGCSKSGRNTSALTNIPLFATNSVKLYKLQAKESTTGADDPVFEGARMYL
jgi:hypothetical protein